MSTCPQHHELERLAEGGLDPAAADVVRAHLGSCVQCRETFDRARADVELLTDIRRIVGEAAESILSRTTGLPGGNLAPVRVAGFELIRLIGEGATAAVFEALQPMPRRSVAVKLLRAWERDGGEQDVARWRARRELFEREAQALARLSHPNIAAVYAAGLSETGRPYIAMELVRGKPLHLHWRDAGLDRRARVELIAAVCDAVQHAHDRGVLHRDLKPSNVMVDDTGHAKVLDFGLARVTAADGSGEPGVAPGGEPTLYSGGGGLLGTLAFMAPEQVRGEASTIDHRCDVYALGALLHVALTDQTPISLAGLSVQEAAGAVCGRAPTAPSAVCPQSPRELDRVVLRALAKNPGERHGSAAALASDLRAWLTGVAPGRTTRTLGVSVLTALGLVTLTAAAVIWWPRRPSPAPPPSMAAQGSLAAATAPEASGPGSGSAAVALPAPTTGVVLQPEWRVTRPLPEELMAQHAELTKAESDSARAAVATRIGLLHEAMGEYGAAEARFAEVIGLRGTGERTPFDLCRRARVLAELERYDEAEVLLDEARTIVRQRPPKGLIWERYELAKSSALVCARRGDHEGAQLQIRRARDLARNFSAAEIKQWAAWLASRVAMQDGGSGPQ